MPATVEQVVRKYNGDASRLMDILIDIQNAQGRITDDAIGAVASGVKLSTVDVAQTVSFYHFFSREKRGTYTVYLNNSAVACMKGRKAVADAFERAAGCAFGEVSGDGVVGLFDTADIGMNDQEPAALINGVVFPSLTPSKAVAVIAGLKAGKPLQELAGAVGDGKNAHAMVHSAVSNNIRKTGAVYLTEYAPGDAIRKIVKAAPKDVIDTMKVSSLRGRGGAGFPTGMKWEFTAKNAADVKFVICNADEGEPGTFKDRVLLTERAEMVFEGMVVAAYAIGASQGIVYLRAEFSYLRGYLESVLANMRTEGLLGKSIAGRAGFDFDIRIQLGAGAYVCGEESALIESAEGRRGEPRNRPPFPAEKGYLNKPTTVNNVETFAAAVQIVNKGAEWFRSIGTDQSSGTKLLSISGDCDKPGVYEVPFGLTITKLLETVGARDTQAVQVGGPSGTCVAPVDFDKVIGFEAYATGGSVIVIGKDRNILEIVHNFMEFFTDESCGSCAPCRAGTRILCSAIEKIMKGKSTRSDLDVLLQLGAVMKISNKCGLGQTAANPVVSTINNFRPVYERAVAASDMYRPGFDMAAAVSESCAFVGRKSGVEA